MEAAWFQNSQLDHLLIVRFLFVSKKVKIGAGTQNVAGYADLSLILEAGESQEIYCLQNVSVITELWEWYDA